MDKQRREELKVRGGSPLSADACEAIIHELISDIERLEIEVEKLREAHAKPPASSG